LPDEFPPQYAALYTMLVTLSQDIVLPLVLSSSFPLINAYPPTQPSPVPETLLWHVCVLRATLRLLSFVKKAFRAGYWNSLYLSHVLSVGCLPRTDCGIAQYLVLP